MQQVARQKAETLGSLKRSITKGKGNLVGYLGQLAVENAVVGMKREETYDYDLVCDGFRYEVKTKDRTVAPLPEYECSIAGYNHSQATDYYIFTSTYRMLGTYIYETVYILGYIHQTEYIHKAKFMKKGDFDPANNFTARADCYNLPISELRSFG
jgi:hypothetical protein